MGRVVDATDDRPLPNATVEVRAASPSAPSSVRGVATDVDGRFRLALAPGRYALTVRHVGYPPLVRDVTLRDGETTQLTLILEPRPFEGAAVTVVGTLDELTEDRRAVASLAAADLERTRGQTLGETLAQLPGVTALTTGPSISKPVIRGLHSDRVVVRSHGLRQEGQQWGGEHAPEIDPFAPAEIRVVKGAAGVEHGAGAIGGVVELEAAPLPTDAGLAGDVMLNGFTNNRQGAGSVRVEGGVSGAQGWGWRVQGSLRRAGDAHTPSGVIGNSAFAERSGAVTLGYHADRGGLEVHASRFDTELGIFRGAHAATVEDFRQALDRAGDYDFSYGIDPPKQSVTHDVVTARGHLALASGGRLEAQYGVQRNVRQEFDAHCRFCDDPGATPAFDLALVSQTLDLTWRSRPLGDAFVAAGLSGMNQGNTNEASGVLVPNFRALTGGGFLRGMWLRGAWTIDAGARVDYRWLRAFPRELGTGDFTRRVTDYVGGSGAVGALWQFSADWSLGANVSTAWRPPSVNELYSRGVHHGTAQFEVGDPALASERMIGTDLTLRHTGSRVQVEASVYANHGQDFILLLPTRETVVTIRGVFPAFAYTQTGARLLGADGSMQVTLTPRLSTGATWSLVRGTDTTNDRPLFGMPSDRTTLFGTLAFPTRNALRDADLRVETTLVRTQTRMPDGVDFAPAPDGYALVGVSFGAETRLGDVPLRWRLAVDNLFNTAYRDILSRYRYFVDEPGRTVVLRLHVPLGRDA